MKEAPRSGESTHGRVEHVPPVAVYEGDVSSGEEQDSLPSKTLGSLVALEERSRGARELDFSLRSHRRKSCELMRALALGQHILPSRAV